MRLEGASESAHEMAASRTNAASFCSIGKSMVACARSSTAQLPTEVMAVHMIISIRSGYRGRTLRQDDSIAAASEHKRMDSYIEQKANEPNSSDTLPCATQSDRNEMHCQTGESDFACVEFNRIDPQNFWMPMDASTLFELK